jgi:hypothetical protein
MLTSANAAGTNSLTCLLKHENEQMQKKLSAQLIFLFKKLHQNPLGTFKGLAYIGLDSVKRLRFILLATRFDFARVQFLH